MTVDANLFRNYDIRGIDPKYIKPRAQMTQLELKSAFSSKLGPDAAEIIAKSIAIYLKPKTVVIGRDTRLNSPELQKAIVKGLTDSGVDVVDIGLAGTDVVWFAVGFYGFDAGLSITASHCEKVLNGIKIAKKGCYPLAMGSGMEELREIALKENFSLADKKGEYSQKDVWQDFVNHAQKDFDIKALKPFKIVADAGNGMGGVAMERVFKNMPCEVIPMYFKPDGNYPNHLPNPQIIESVQELKQRIKKENADLGLSYDGDGDRVFFFDETGERIEVDYIAALLVKKMIGAGEIVVYTANMSNILKDKAAEIGAKSIRGKVGNSFIKQVMHDNNARFGCEASGHFFLKESYYAETVYIPILHILELMSQTGKKLSELIAEVGKGYHFSQEINIETPNSDIIIDKLRQEFSMQEIDNLDGLTIINPDWQFNIRPSSNDPMVRLRVAARTAKKVEEIKEQVISLINS